MHAKFSESQTWIIAFSADAPKWWQRLLKDGFKHVRLFKQEGSTYYMLDSLLHAFVFIGYSELPDNHKYLVKVVHYGEHYKPMPLEPLTCVSFVKRVLCIRSRWIITPYQLYKELIRAGAFMID